MPGIASPSLHGAAAASGVSWGNWDQDGSQSDGESEGGYTWVDKALMQAGAGGPPVQGGLVEGQLALRLDRIEALLEAMAQARGSEEPGAGAGAGAKVEAGPPPKEARGWFGS